MLMFLLVCWKDFDWIFT